MNGRSRNWVFSAVAAFLVAQGAVGIAAPSSASAAEANVPAAATNVVFRGTPTATTLRVSWKPASAGAAAAAFAIMLEDDAGGVAWPSCAAPCTSKILPGLVPGRSYRAWVIPMNAVGWGPATPTRWQVITSGCADPLGTCLTLDATQPSGAASQRAAGFLHSASHLLQPSTATDLHPSWWRVRVQPGMYQDFDLASAAGAQVILILSDAWYNATFTPSRGGAAPPWEDWQRYRTWVRGYVRDFLATGRRPAYWEVMNEPGIVGFLNAADTAAWTPERTLEQFRAAYEEIKAVDPNADIVGPSSDVFALTPNLYGPRLDLRTFIDYVAANNLHPAAIVWHEVHANWTTGDLTSLPVEIQGHVADIRSLLTMNGLADTKILIDEYSSPETFLLPGWSVGYITAFEGARVEGAGRSCFPTLASTGWVYSGCEIGLNGLYAEDDVSPLSNYWVYKFYAAMTGTRIATTISTAKLDAFAVQGSDGTVRALIGRHETCSGPVVRDCHGAPPSTPPPVAAQIDMVVASTVATAHVVVARIPVPAIGPPPPGSIIGGLLGKPPPVPQLGVYPVPVIEFDVAPSAGRFSLTLPAVQDGEAYTVIVTPTS